MQCDGCFKEIFFKSSTLVLVNIFFFDYTKDDTAAKSIFLSASRFLFDVYPNKVRQLILTPRLIRVACENNLRWPSTVCARFTDSVKLALGLWYANTAVNEVIPQFHMKWIIKLSFDPK